MKLSPALTGLRTYPFVRLAEAKRSSQADGVDLIDFGIGEPREETPAFIREALVAALEPLSTYPRRDGLPELRAAIAELDRRGASASRSTPTRRCCRRSGSKEAIFHLAQVLGGDLVAVPAPAYPVYERGAVFAGKEVLELPLREDDGFLPDLDAVPARHVARRRAAVAQLPEQPDRRDRAARALRARRGAGARARLRRRLRRGLLGDLLRRRAAASRRSSSPTCTGVVGVQHALQALVDARLPVGLRGRRPGADRAAQALPAQRRRRAAGVRPARGGRRVARRGARRGRCAPATAPSATCCCRCSRRAGCATPAATRRSSSGSTPGPQADMLAERLLDAGIVLAPGSFFGPAGAGYLRLALVPTLAGLRARGRAARPPAALSYASAGLPATACG